MGRKYLHDVTSPRNKAFLCILQSIRARICLCSNILLRGKEAGNMPAILLPQLNGIFHLPQVQLKKRKTYKNASDTRIKALLLQHNSLVVNNNLREFMMFCFCLRVADEVVIILWWFVFAIKQTESYEFQRRVRSQVDTSLFLTFVTF